MGRVRSVPSSGLGVVLADVKVFVIDVGDTRNRLSTYGLVMLLIIGALVLRVTMPVLPK